MKKKICVVTATRAEYGPLFPLLSKLKKDSFFELQLVVTGTHLSQEFGYTIAEIEKDGIPIVRTFEILLSSDSPTAISKSMGLASISFAEVLHELSPDLILLIGDRYELLPLANCALVANIPIAHISGGELTEGAIDDTIRHCLTKLAFLHFTAIEVYRKRVIQLGESPDRVHVVGEIGLDNIKNLNLLDREAFEKSIGRKLKTRNFLITYHPVTISPREVTDEFKATLEALDQYEDALLIFTKANADEGGRSVNQMIEEYVKANVTKAVCFASLGKLRYLSALALVDVMVGNSSSGIVEAASFKLPVVNIGDRQKGRLKGRNVIDTDRNNIDLAIKKSLSSEFKLSLQDLDNIYGDGNSANRILKILKNLDWNGTFQKKFFDIEFAE